MGGVHNIVKNVMAILAVLVIIMIMNITTGSPFADVFIFLVGVTIGYVTRVIIEKREKRKAGL